eukprot:12007472-Alexandrium_andersonii.AAC.1
MRGVWSLVKRLPAHAQACLETREVGAVQAQSEQIVLVVSIEAASIVANTSAAAVGIKST